MTDTLVPHPTRPPRGRARQRLRSGAVLGLALVVVAAATACLSTPGRTDQVALIDSTTVDGWHYDYYRNSSYPCSISGYQTFAIGTKVGSSNADTRPLWVKMRGGGTGWFDADGNPQPTAGTKSEISLSELLTFDTAGLMVTVKDAPEGFRTLLVSMCSQDIYAGNNTPDPNNPNLTPDGKPRPTTGLIATKAAIQYTRAHYPTDHFFLHGTSAGGAGTFGVAWALQQQGIPPTGLISDSGVVDQTWEQEVLDQGTCGSEPIDAGTALLARIDPDLANVANQPDELVSRGALTVPIMHVWNHGDHNSCGETPMQCTVRNGTTLTIGAADCRHEDLRAAIAALGPDSRSANMAVCVEGSDTANPCDEHVVTTRAHGVNSAPGAPADYQAAIMTWVRARLADS
jgi:hypothetical protein